MKKTIQMVSKSVQFTDETLKAMDILAKELGMTRLKGGAVQGDVSKVVRRMADYVLADQESFRKWQAGGNGSKARKE